MSGRVPDVIAIGEPLVEWLTDGNLEQASVATRSFGGDALNFAIQAARLGLRSAIATRWSDDPFGQALMGFAQAEGVECLGPVDPTRSTGHYWASHRGNAHFAYARAGSASAALDLGDLDGVRGWLETSVLLFSGVSLGISPTARACVLDLARSARRAVFDLQHRAKLVSPEQSYEQVRQLAPTLWLFVAGQEEVRLVFGSLDRACDTLVRWGMGRFAIRGKEGTVLHWNGQTSTLAPHRLNLPVVDESGAGDAWDATFVSSLLEGRDVIDAVRRADIVGGLMVSRVGCATATPQRSELDALAQPP